MVRTGARLNVSGRPEQPLGAKDHAVISFRTGARRQPSEEGLPRGNRGPAEHGMMKIYAALLLGRLASCAFAQVASVSQSRSYADNALVQLDFELGR